MEDLKRIAAVHDISGMGKCSLTVALPVISASGVECACLPTALLSTHTGEFTDFTFRDLSQELLPIAKHWQNTGAEFDGIYSGYLASAKQAELLSQVIDTISTEKTKIIVDPVMADNGVYYSNHGEEMCRAFRKLCARADIITPNITEAALLTGQPYVPGPHDEQYISRLISGLGEICSGVVAITGYCPDSVSVGVISCNMKTGERFVAVRPQAPGIFYGTGDIFAASFSALMIRGASLEGATQTAVSLVGDCISRTVRRNTPRRFGVDFEGALPSYILQVADLLG